MPALLPVRTAPLAGETIASYLTLGGSREQPPAPRDHRCPAAVVRRQGLRLRGHRQTGTARSPTTHGAWTRSSGITEPALRHALPALAGHRDDGRPPVRATVACRHCAARHGHHDPVPVHLPAHRRACERHRTWLGRAIQIDLAATPEIISASRKAARIARQHGITRLVLAETTARQQAAGDPRWPAAHRDACHGQSRPGSRAPGHRRSSGLPRHDQDGRRDPPRPRHTPRRAGITGKRSARAIGGPT